ncbi:MAG: aminoglycoside phosphotransferase family protein [Clostridia bacterium]
MKLTIGEVRELIARFVSDGVSADPVPFGGGHINDTYLFECKKQGAPIRYILQRVNTKAFPKPHEVMENMQRVTEYLRERIGELGGDPTRETLELSKTQDGHFFAVDHHGDSWRVYRFVDDTITYDRAENPQIMAESGRAFGRFLCMLDGFDATTLHETIERFHDTPSRYLAFHEAVRRNPVGRAAGVQKEIQEVLSYEPFAPTLVSALSAGKLPLRVTHNDTKLNNVLFDSQTERALCVIDLDTVMPGLTAYDFGDAIRFGASTADEDEPDLAKVHFSLPLYRAYAEGFLEEAGAILTQAELRSLPDGVKMMTLESAVRFLTDYLNGDTYFKTAHPEHNLVRTRTQIKLLEEIDAHWQELLSVVHLPMKEIAKDE